MGTFNPKHSAIQQKIYKIAMLMVFQTDIYQSTQLVPHVAAEQTLDLIGCAGYFDRSHCFEDW